MIYTPAEYAKAFTFGKIHLSERSIRRRCILGQLPKGHIPHRKRGGWIIEVERFPEALMKQFNVSLKLKAAPQP